MKILKFRKKEDPNDVWNAAERSYRGAWLWRAKFQKAIIERRLMKSFVTTTQDQEVKACILTEIDVYGQIARLSLTIYRMNKRIADQKRDHYLELKAA